MKGKDLLLGMNYVNVKFVEEAENVTQLREEKKILSLRRPVLIAALIAMLLMLVGCVAAYVLRMDALKIGETTDEQYVYAEDGVSILGTETVNLEVLTLSGLEGSEGYQAALAWYKFMQSYDPKGEIQTSTWGNEPAFPAEYQHYGLYSQEMKDALDAILKEHKLKPVGAQLDFRTTKNMCQALGIERILTTYNGVMLRSDSGAAYENGNFWLNLDVELPGNAEVTNTSAVLYWNRKDCFSSDLITIEATGDWKEWNYTTAAGNNVLIIRSPSDRRGWIIYERKEAMMFLQIDTRIDCGYNVDGKTWWEQSYMTDNQMELVADAIDFNIQPKLVNPSAVKNQPALPSSATQNGYTLTLKSVETDGYVARVVVGVTAPEGTDIESLNIGTGTNYDEFTSDAELVWGSGGFNDVSDGDGLRNTKDLVMIANYTLADGSMPFAVGSRWNLHIVDIVVDKYCDTERILVEGEWWFPITFDNSTSDGSELDLIQKPIQMDVCVGLRPDGSPVVKNVTVTSFTLRKFSATIEHSGGASADFTSLNGELLWVVMKDGTRIQLHGGSTLETDAPVDLEQVDYISFADGTKLKAAQSESAPAT